MIRPFLSIAMLAALSLPSMAAEETSSWKLVVVALNGGQRIFPQLDQLQCETGARYLVRPEKVTTAEVTADPGLASLKTVFFEWAEKTDTWATSQGCLNGYQIGGDPVPTAPTVEQAPNGGLKLCRVPSLTGPIGLFHAVVYRGEAARSASCQH